MQPTLIFTAAHSGILYLNGHFAGELSPDAPLIRPAAAMGALIMEFHPLSDELRPMARRLVFSGGAPLQDALEQAEGLSCILWPEGVTELELSPAPYELRRQSFSLDGFHFLLEEGAQPRLLCEGRQLTTLPPDAQPPELRRLRDCLTLTGKCRDGRYLICTDPALRGVTGFLQAQEIELQEDGRIRSLAASGDLTGHAVREDWQISAAGLQLLTATAAWEAGAPRWPQTPCETAIAAVEAEMAALHEEAEGYLSPTLRARNPLPEIAAACDLCIRLKYGGSGTDAVGLLRLEGGNLARVTPLRFRAIPSECRSHPWQLDALDFP